VNIGTPNATAANRITAVADLVFGDQLAYNTKSGTVVVLADGTFNATTTVNSFAVEAWTSPDGWGSTNVQTLFANTLSKFGNVLSASLGTINGVAKATLHDVNGVAI
jgi:hypothetical protein